MTPLRFRTSTRALLGVLSVAAVILTATTGADPVTPAPAPAPAPAVAEAPAEAQLARGKYLATHVAMCIDCHSEHDRSRYSGPLVPNTLGQGGDPFPGDFGMLISPNITPHGIGDWTDEELYAALTTGKRKSGSYIFPLMPWPSYSQMAESDLRAIIAYIRTLPSIEKDNPASEYKVPVDLIAKSIPVPTERPPMPDPKDKVAYGRYLVNAASCSDCHTQQGPQGPNLELAFAGGMRFDLPWNPVVAANITPDKETGIGNWTEQQFLERFQMYRDKVPKRAEGQPETIMPWTFYAGMTDADIKAIYAYLRTVPPVKNAVTTFPRK